MTAIRQALRLDEHGLVRWAPGPPPVGPRTVAEVLDRTLAEDPGRQALVDDDRSFTYAELDLEVNRVAAVLRAEGLRPGDRLAACLPNATDVVVAFLAAMRSGLVWVGINRALAPPERAVLVADSGAALLLAETDADVPADVRVARVDGGWRERVDAAPSYRPDVVVDPFAPAGIAFTSGTTGTPKGAVHSQHNMLLPGTVALAEGTVAPHARHGAVLPLTILNMQILAVVKVMMCGGTCIPLRRIDVLGLAESVGRHRVEHVAVPPTTAIDLLTNPDVVDEDIVSLTDLGVGGASAPPGLLERYRKRFGRAFLASYGLTEAPTAVTWENRPERPPGSSGTALAHVAVAVTDADGGALPAGVEGEIWVGPRTEGPFAGVYRPMLGYWNRPGATREALTADGWLRTGDAGRLDEDGVLHVVGRRNDLIVRGGANVYPAEVEIALTGHPDVAEAAVIGRPDERLGETVLAVVRPREGSTLTAADLQEFCRGRLARYKIPAEVLFVAELPRNAMGKVVKKTLRERLT
jgi:long-chain acyl-CoA synthetase